MEFETGRRSTLARLQLSVQGLAGSLNSAKKVLVASTVLTAAFCGAVFGLTLVANEASKESHIENGLLISTDGETVATDANKNFESLSELSAVAIAKKDFVSFSQDGADRYMQILGVQATASKKVINTIVGAFEVTEEGMTFAGDNVVVEATEADKAARKALCKVCGNGGRNTQCKICGNGRRTFAVTGRNPFCAICSNNGRNFQCKICGNGRSNQCAICNNGGGRSQQCKICTNGRNAQCLACANRGRNYQCSVCNNGRNALAAPADAGSDCGRMSVTSYVEGENSENRYDGERGWGAADIMAIDGSSKWLTRGERTTTECTGSETDCYGA